MFILDRFSLPKWLIATCLALTILSPQALAQPGIQGFPGSGTGTGLGTGAGAFGGIGGLGDGGGVAGGMPGGAAQADFTTLMNLIQQTIDPDSWLANGGTSTILPYPSGVYVDPAGHLKRVQEQRQVSASVLGKSGKGPRHPWRTASGLRTVSLKQLDQALAMSLHRGLSPAVEIQKLAGLSRIEYVRIDVETEDILIAGPADGVESAVGFELQDVAVVAALINSRTSPLGCSIEPSNDGLRAAQAYLQGQGVIKQLSRKPQLVVDQMQAKIGPHNVLVFGMAPNTGTAVALIDADEHMKKVGFGTVDPGVRIDSYFEHLSKQDKVPQQSMIRWWFAYGDSPIQSNPQKDVFQLPKQCVAVLSEQQWVTQQGRAPTGGNDLAADAFAKGMTERLGELRKTHPSYARLSAVFEIGLALQLAIEKTGQPNLQAWLPTLCSIGALAPESNVKPRTVEGLTTWNKLKSGTIVAVVSGGVKIDARTLTRPDAIETSKFLASSLVPTTPERVATSHGNWWWDAR